MTSCNTYYILKLDFVFSDIIKISFFLTDSAFIYKIYKTLFLDFLSYLSLSKYGYLIKKQRIWENHLPYEEEQAYKIVLQERKHIRNAFFPFLVILLVIHILQYEHVLILP
jgi:hypothetical protein